MVKELLKFLKPMIASFTDPAHYATFRCVPFSYKWYQSGRVACDQWICIHDATCKISRCIRFECLDMIYLCGTNLGDADAKNNPSMMVAKSSKLNYCILVNVIL